MMNRISHVFERPADQNHGFIDVTETARRWNQSLSVAVSPCVWVNCLDWPSRATAKQARKAENLSLKMLVKSALAAFEEYRNADVNEIRFAAFTSAEAKPMAELIALRSQSPDGRTSLSIVMPYEVNDQTDQQESDEEEEGWPW